jgi:hypothetical protein
VLALPLALYAALAALYPLAETLPIARKLWAQIAKADWRMLLAHTLIYVGLFACYGLIIKNAAGVRVRWLWLAFLTSAGALLFAFPGESSDIFDYIFRGRMLFEYGRSPLLVPPSVLKEAPFYRYVTWADWIDAYGPLWEYTSAGLAWLVRLGATPAQLTVVSNLDCDKQAAACSYLLRYVTAYRLFAITCIALSGLVLQFALPPAQRRRGVALLLLNPLVLISAALGAHNDALMLLFVSAGVALLMRAPRWAMAGIVLLLLAAHVKLTALILLPVALIWLWRRDGLRPMVFAVCLAGAIAVPTSWLLYQPLGGWVTLTRNLYERSVLSTNSIGELIYLYVRYGRGVDRWAAQISTGRAMTVAFALIAGLRLILWWWRAPRNEATNDTLARLMLGIAVLYFLVGSFWFQPWYVSWVVTLAAFVPTAQRGTRIAFTYSAASLFVMLFADYARHAKPALLEGWPLSALIVAVLWLAVLGTMSHVIVSRKSKNLVAR